MVGQEVNGTQIINRPSPMLNIVQNVFRPTKWTIEAPLI